MHQQDNLFCIICFEYKKEIAKKRNISSCFRVTREKKTKKKKTRKRPNTRDTDVFFVFNSLGLFQSPLATAQHLKSDSFEACETSKNRAFLSLLAPALPTAFYDIFQVTHSYFQENKPQ